MKNRNDAEVAIAADAGVQTVKEEHSGVPTEGLGLLYGALDLELARDITG